MHFLKKICIYVCCLNKIVDNATNYENLIFLPEIYTKYIEVTPKSVINISTDLLEHMRTCSYVCDYRNMYNYGKIAYYFLNQKEAVEWSESDYMILFYYGFLYFIVTESVALSKFFGK